MRVDTILRVYAPDYYLPIEPSSDGDNLKYINYKFALSNCVLVNADLLSMLFRIPTHHVEREGFFTLLKDTTPHFQDLVIKTDEMGIKFIYFVWGSVD